MKLHNTFTVNIAPQETWKVLMDLERVAKSIPGAAILDVQGEVYHGAVKIKVGPVSTQYKGTVEFTKRDEQELIAVIKAVGSDTGGQGNVDAFFRIALTEQSGTTKVDMETEVAMSGRVAQFGRGAVADVANKILKQFVKNLESDIASGGAHSDGKEDANSTSGANEGGVSSRDEKVSMDDIEPLDAFGSFGGVIVKYALPVVGAVAALAVGVIVMRRSKQSRSSGRIGQPANLPSVGHQGALPAGPTIVPIIFHDAARGEAAGQTWVRDLIPKAIQRGQVS